MSNKPKESSRQHWIAAPKNSIISWLYTLIWETCTGVIGFTIFTDAWSAPNAGVILAFLLAGLVLNVLLFLIVVFWEGYSNKTLENMFSDGMKTEHITKWIYWAFDQTHFLTNTIFYFFATIFFGVFLGIKNGFIAYQPLGPVPAPMDIQNIIIFKGFAFLMVAIAGANYYFNFSTHKWILIHILRLMGKSASALVSRRYSGNNSK